MIGFGRISLAASGRIPVILTHGLVSVPIVWRNIIPEVMSDPEISRRYQFMVFTYPTSYPVYELARLFRENLAALRAKYDPAGRHPFSADVVAIGHSMGGILTRTLVTDIEDRLWRQFCDEPFDEAPLASRDAGGTAGRDLFRAGYRGEPRQFHRAPPLRGR